MSQAYAGPDDSVVGRRIVEVRPLTAAECERSFGDTWNEAGVVLVLDNGIELFPSRDPEGNGPGAMFGYDHRSGGDFTLYAEESIKEPTQ